jgi:hydrogenase maturation protein HypF
VQANGDGALIAAVDALRNGAIVAIKGIGGYHLAVDATNADAVRALRRRKARDDKPFAVMVPDLRSARALCELDDDSIAALESLRRPIVLAPRRATSSSLTRSRRDYVTSACSCPTRRCTTCCWQVSAVRS